MSAPSDQTWTVEIKEDDLPLLAQVAVEAMRLIDREETKTKDLDRLISSDPALAARILRIANSPLFAGTCPANTVHQAVVRMGMLQLKQIVLLAALNDVFDPRKSHPRAIWNHAIAVAVASQWLSEQLGIGQPDESFLGGLLHDVGKLIIYQQIPEVYGTLIDQATKEGKRFHEHETGKIMPCAHPSVGALVGLKWGLSADLIEVMQFHHQIEQQSDLELEAESLVALVSVANLLAHQLGLGDEVPLAVDALSSLPAQTIGLDAQVVEQACEVLPAMVQEQGSAFS